MNTSTLPSSARFIRLMLIMNAGATLFTFYRWATATNVSSTTTVALFQAFIVVGFALSIYLAWRIPQGGGVTQYALVTALALGWLTLAMRNLLIGYAAAPIQFVVPIALLVALTTSSARAHFLRRVAEDEQQP